VKRLKSPEYRFSAANPRWGSPRILGELCKLGIDVAKSTVEKYRLRHLTPPSPTWRAFLKNQHELAQALHMPVRTLLHVCAGSAGRPDWGIAVYLFRERPARCAFAYHGRTHVDPDDALFVPVFQGRCRVPLPERAA
jgi:hypothetical protein